MTVFLYTGIFGLFYFFISISVIKARHRNKVSLGPGKENEIVHLVSAHSNFASYTPFFLICLFLLETGGASQILIHVLALAFLTGRVLHFLTMRNQEKTFKFRKAGMMLTFWPLIISCFRLIAFYVSGLLLGQ